MTKVEVTDQYGGSVSAMKEIVTGLIYVEIDNVKGGYKDNFYLDLKDETHVKWLKNVFQPIHLSLLLDDPEHSGRS
jgi:hypothetical protein